VNRTAFCPFVECNFHQASEPKLSDSEALCTKPEEPSLRPINRSECSLCFRAAQARKEAPQSVSRG